MSFRNSAAPLPKTTNPPNPNPFDAFTYRQLDTLWSALYDSEQDAIVQQRPLVATACRELIDQMYSARNWPGVSERS